MRNNLVFEFGAIFSGKDINEWIWDQITHERKNKKLAQHFVDHFIVMDNCYYKTVKMLCGKKTTFGFIKVA